ncbi:hypothetical protein [Sphingosinithalassobacter portus]|uniref:hypothetical protein n=1 Tax=Stakelama portus TaxID=2676234 RepID=UPI0011AB840D|nr:hypothetical protein [Sphingosinithalassobacter portus]
MTRGADGMRVLSAHCEMALDGVNVVRDSLLAVDGEYHPHDATVRIMNDGRWSGDGWFRFDEDIASCEAVSRSGGRVSQRVPISRPMRGFGQHALQSDAWLTATYPIEKGPGSQHFWGTNLMHSLHHLGATGPALEQTSSGLEFVGREAISVAAGDFTCFRMRLIGISNDHPPYDMWVTDDGDFLYVKGVVAGYMDSVFELESLSGGPL